MGVIAFNCQAEMAGLADAQLPLLAILHDDRPDFLAPFAGKNVWAYRAMSPYSTAFKALPPNARFIFDNEADHNLDVTRTVAYLTQLKIDRPDIVLLSPASNTANWPDDGEWPEDQTIKNMCYFYSIHMPTFGTSEQLRARVGAWGNPWCVTEVEADPTDRANLGHATLAARLLAGARTALEAGAQCAAIWGKDPQLSDGILIDSLRAAVAAFNASQQPSQGAQTMATPTEQNQDQEIATNFAQVTDLVEALRRIRQGKWTGADGVDGMIVALQGGKPLDFTPSFP